MVLPVPQNLLCIDIFEAYTQILLCKENLYISKYQVELDSIQYESAKALEQVGRLSYIDVSRQNALFIAEQNVVHTKPYQFPFITFGNDTVAEFVVSGWV